MRDCTGGIRFVEKVIKDINSKIVSDREYAKDIREDNLSIRGIWAKVKGEKMTEDQVQS